jgi:hypothetical protein
MKTFKPWLSLVCILELALIGFGDAGPLVMELGKGDFIIKDFHSPQMV